jgi:glycylpeptide N-tetradecanoyltransferase
MKNKDISQVCKLLNLYLENNSKVYLKFTEEDVKHFLLPRENVIYSYVIENTNKHITDFVSFYNLPSSVLQNPKYTHINVIYIISHYNIIYYIILLF